MNERSSHNKAFVVHGDGGTGKTALISSVLKVPSYPGYLGIETVYWHNATVFTPEKFFDDFDSQFDEEISHAMGPSERFRERQKQLDKTLVIVFDDVYDFNFDSIVSVVQEFEAKTWAILIARNHFKSNCLAEPPLKINQLRRKEIEAIVSHSLVDSTSEPNDLETPAKKAKTINEINPSFISHVSEVINEITAGLALWVGIVSRQLCQFKTRKEIQRHLDKLKSSELSLNQPRFQILLGFDNLPPKARRFCYALLAFGEAAQVKTQDVAVLVDCHVEEAFEQMNDLADRCLIRFDISDRDHKSSQANIHAILFHTMMNHLTHAENNCPNISSNLVNIKDVTKRVEQLVLNFFDENYRIFHRVINEKRGLLLRMIVDTLLINKNFESVYNIFSNSRDSEKPALLKLLTANQWTMGPSLRRSPWIEFNFHLEIFIEAIDRLLIRKHDATIELLQSSGGLEYLRKSCQSNETNQSHNAAFYATLMNCGALLKLLFADENSKIYLNNVDERGNTSLYLAVRNSCMVTSINLFEIGADPTILNRNNHMAAVEAAFRGRERILNAMIQSPVCPDLNIMDGRGFSPIVGTLLLHPPNENSFKLLLQQPTVDVSAKSNKYGVSCFDLCQALGHPELASLIKALRPNDKLHRSTTSNVRLYSLMLQIRSPLEIDWPEGYDDLFRTVIDDNVGEFETLLDRVPDPTQRQNLLKASFAASAWVNTVGIAEKCHQLGSSIVLGPITKNGGNHAVNFAAWHNSVDVLKFLLNIANVSPNVTNQFGHTPLHACCWPDNVESAQVLLEHTKIDPNAKQLGGTSILHACCHYKGLRVLEVLINNPKVNLNTTDFQGITPLHCHLY